MGQGRFQCPGCGLRCFWWDGIGPEVLWPFRPSVNFPCDLETIRVILAPLEIFCQILSTFRVARRTSVNFRQLSVQQGDLPSTSINILCHWETFPQLPSSFCTAGRPFVKFWQLSVWPEELPSIFVSFPCSRETFHQLPSTFVLLVDLPSTSISIPYGWETLCQNFRATERPSVNFH